MSESSSRWFAPALIGLATLSSVVQIVLVWGTTFPLGVPGEWVWERTAFTATDIIGLWPCLAFAVALLLVATWVGRRIESMRTPTRIGCLIGLWLLGTGWLFSLLAATPGIAGLGRVPFVLYYPRSSGYFTQSQSVADLPEFLAGYRQQIDASDEPENYLHLGTHPPGLTSAYCIMQRTAERSPTLTAFLNSTQPATIADAFASIRQNVRASGGTLRDSEIAAIWMMTLLTGLTATLTCLPLYWIACRVGTPLAAWWTAVVWLLVPAMAVFFPKSDLLLPGLAFLSQACWLKALWDDAPVWGLATGLLAFLCMLISLAFLPIGLILVLQFFFVRRDEVSTATAHQGRWRSRLKLLGWSAIPFIVLVIATWLASGLNLVSVWMQNLRNHAAFYEHHSRTYLPWLVENPIELGCALGMPLAISALCGLVLLICRLEGRRPALLIPALVWAVLWLSGKNMGEAARLWLFLMPYALLWASLAWQKLTAASSGRRWLLALIVLQVVTCVATVLRVDGFQFASLLPGARG